MQLLFSLGELKKKVISILQTFGGRSDLWNFVIAEECDVLLIFYLICLCSLEPPLVYFFFCEKLLCIAEESKFQKESLKYTCNINAVGLVALLYFCDNLV